MTVFEDRERAFEAKWQHDEELRFRIISRRNRMLGIWAAHLMGMTADQADAYARDVVAAGFDKPGNDEVHDKLEADLRAAGIDLSDHRLRKQIAALQAEARDQIMSEVD